MSIIDFLFIFLFSQKRLPVTFMLLKRPQTVKKNSKLLMLPSHTLTLACAFVLPHIVLHVKKTQIIKKSKKSIFSV